MRKRDGLKRCSFSWDKGLDEWGPWERDIESISIEFQHCQSFEEEVVQNLGGDFCSMVRVFDLFARTSTISRSPLPGSVGGEYSSSIASIMIPVQLDHFLVTPEKKLTQQALGQSEAYKTWHLRAWCSLTIDQNHSMILTLFFPSDFTLISEASSETSSITEQEQSLGQMIPRFPFEDLVFDHEGCFKKHMLEGQSAVT